MYNAPLAMPALRRYPPIKEVWVSGLNQQS